MSANIQATRTTTLAQSRYCAAPPGDAWQALELVYGRLYKAVASGEAMRALAAGMKSPRVVRRVRLRMSGRLGLGARLVVSLWRIPLIRLAITEIETNRSLAFTVRAVVLRIQATLAITPEGSGCMLSSWAVLPGLAGRIAQPDLATGSASTGESVVDLWVRLAEHIHEPGVLARLDQWGVAAIEPPLWNSPE